MFSASDAAPPLGALAAPAAATAVTIRLVGQAVSGHARRAAQRLGPRHIAGARGRAQASSLGVAACLRGLLCEPGAAFTWLRAENPLLIDGEAMQGMAHRAPVQPGAPTALQ